MKTPRFFVPVTLPPRHHRCGSFRAGRSSWRIILLLLLAAGPASRAALNAVAVSPDGKTAIAGGDAKTLYVWPLVEDGVVRTLPAGETIFALSWSPDRRSIVAGTARGCQIWRRTGAEYAKIAVFRPERAVLSAVISPDGATVALGVEGSGSLYFYDLSSKEQVGELFERGNLTSGMAWSPDGFDLATAGNSFTEWNVRPGSLPKPPPGRQTVDEALAMSASARLWTATVPAFAEYAAAVACDPGGKILAGVNGAGGRGPRAGGKTLRVWEAKTGRTLRTSFSTGLRCVAFLASGELVTGSDDGKLRVWDVGTGRVTREWMGHKGEIRGLSAVPNNPNFVSAGEDDRLCVWNPENGKRVRSITFGPK